MTFHPPRLVAGTPTVSISQRPPECTVTTPSPPKMLTVAQVAEITSLSKMSVYRLINKSELRAYRMGHTIRVDARDLTEYVWSCNTIAWEFNGGGES